MVSSRAALLYAPGEDYQIETVEIDEPRAGEVLIEMRACGLCHSDEHARTGDLPLAHYPTICGHEGAGKVVRVGGGWGQQRGARRPCGDVVRAVLRCLPDVSHQPGVPV